MARDDAMSGWEDVEIQADEAAIQRCDELGVPADLVLRAVFDGQHAADLCHGAHPVFYAGSRVYGETNGTLRLGLAERKWSFNDDNCIPRAISPDGSVVITAVAGDSRTGRRNSRDVQTRRPRRSGSLRIVRRNTQLILLDLFAPDDAEVVEIPAPIGPTWFVMWYRDGDTVRVEVSLAKGVTKEGRLLEWLERNILPEIDMLAGPPGPRPDRPDEDAPDVDVPVIPKAG